ncbi:MAG: glycosyltransferase [Actinobacteria bacterium]|nr:glycosyltransferase [Actinomycetota bacterium]
MTQSLVNRTRETSTPNLGKIAILSTYPPTECGIATFAKSLESALLANGQAVDIVRLTNGESKPSPANVVADHNGQQDLAATCELLNSYDHVLIQHEFGIFAGNDGEEVTDIIDGLSVPVSVVLHTVLTEPTLNQRTILNHIAKNSDALITMTQTGKAKLIANYAANVANVHVIGHGARAIHSKLVEQANQVKRPRILTWGLIGPGKGIEWAIDALAILTDLDPKPEYIIAGQTHPHVKQRSGESYRHWLRDRIARQNLTGSVFFLDHYLTEPELDDLIATADIVLLPYDSVEQVTSGVLVEAVVAGVPIVATNFPHAREVLSDNSGLLVNQKDAIGIALAIRAILTSKNRADAMRSRLRRKSPGFLWPEVGRRYLDVLSGLADSSDLKSGQKLVG